MTYNLKYLSTYFSNKKLLFMSVVNYVFPPDHLTERHPSANVLSLVPVNIMGLIIKICEQIEEVITSFTVCQFKSPVFNLSWKYAHIFKYGQINGRLKQRYKIPDI